jgi:hypothetical protein
VEQRHLVAYDYGMGGLWAVVIASSPEAISARYPEVAVANERPHWMTDERYRELSDDPVWLDEEVPSGIFRAVLADRDRD